MLNLIPLHVKVSDVGGRDIALPTRSGDRNVWVVFVNRRVLFPRVRSLVCIIQEAVWALRPVWMGRENFGNTGLRTPYRPACSSSLYRLRYSGRYIGHLCLYLYMVTISLST